MPKFKELNLTYKDTPKTITVNNIEIQVKQYLPISDKNDLIEIALQKAEEAGIYNEILLDVYFHLNLIYLYTDLEFSDEDKADALALYDILDSNGVLDAVIANMDESEYNNLREMIMVMRDRHLSYDGSAAAVLSRIVQDLPKNAAAAKEIVDSFDPEKYPEIVNFATMANGGRNINTNQPMDAINLQTAPISPAAQVESVSVEPPKRKIVKIEQATKKD